MAFAWEGKTPEGHLSRKQSMKIENAPFDVVVSGYSAEAETLLNGKDALAVRDELGRFAKTVTTATEGVERDEYTERLFNALRGRKIQIPDGLDTRRERAAFGMALSRAYLRSIQ
ncbi:MAG: hypothetical protein AAB927_03815 [Patescibacteria group bacterium]